MTGGVRVHFVAAGEWSVFPARSARPPVARRARADHPDCRRSFWATALPVCLWSLLAVLCLAESVSAADPNVSAVRIDESATSGTLTAIDRETVQLTAAGGEAQSLKIVDLRSLRFPDVAAPSPFADPPTIEVILRDGSRLACTAIETQPQEARVTVEELGELKLPLSALRAVRLGDPEKIAARWDELLQRDNTADLLVVRKQDVLDFVEGSLGDIKAESITFLLNDRSVSVPRDRAFGVLYGSRAATADRPVAEVLVGRSRLQLKELTFAAGEGQGQFAAGPAIPLPFERIHGIEFSGRVRFLGDLQPVVVLPEGAAPEERFRYFRRGSEPFGAPLRIGSNELTMSEGLWLHSGVTARYRINRDFRRLVAIVGMDHNVGGNRAVRLVIVGDGQSLFDQTIRWSDPAREIDLDVANVRDLEIRVERLPEEIARNLLGIQEHLDLGQIRLIR